MKDLYNIISESKHGVKLVFANLPVGKEIFDSIVKTAKEKNVKYTASTSNYSISFTEFDTAADNMSAIMDILLQYTEMLRNDMQLTKDSKRKHSIETFLKAYDKLNK